MSFDPISALFTIGSTLVDRLVADPNAKAEQLFALEKLRQEGNLAELQAQVQSLVGQLEINKTEAMHKSIFVAGWRPFCGWVGGVALGYAAIVEPLLRFGATMYGYSGEFPVIDTDITLQVLFGMLGLGAYRTYEKKHKVQSDSIKKPQ